MPRRPSTILAALLAGAAVVAAALLLVGGGDAEVGPNVLVTPPGPIDANNSPHVVRNPTDPDNVVVVNRVDRPNYSAALRWSLDGGTVWRTTALPLPAGKDRPFAPDAAFAPDGTLYVSYVNLTGPGNSPEVLWLATSEDGGRTLSPPVRVAGRWTFQARIAVDRDETVHLTWLEVQTLALLAIPGPTRVVAVRSEDGGRTFSAPAQVSDPHRIRVGAATPVIDETGDLVVLYQDFKDDVRDFGNLEGPAWDRPLALVLTRSGDGGRTFSRGIEFESNVVPFERFLVFLPPFPSIAAGPEGSIYVAWADGRNGDADVFVRRSPDGGRSWTPPVRVQGPAGAEGTDQYLPEVAAAPGGRVDVLFLDRGGDPRNVMTDAVLATSTDDAATFRPLRVSSASFSSRIGSSAAAHLPPDFGTRLGLESWDGGAVAAWTDTRHGSEASGRQDIVSAVVELPDPASERTGRLLVLGLLLGAAVALGAPLLRGRRGSTPPAGAPRSAPVEAAGGGPES